VFITNTAEVHADLESVQPQIAMTAILICSSAFRRLWNFLYVLASSTTEKKSLGSGDVIHLLV